MASSKEDGTAAAAQQLGSMSLGESAGRKDNEPEPNAKNGNTPAKLCSACGKKSDTLKKCTACKCVWYCNVACQKRHRSEHKKECKCIKKELDTAAKQLGSMSLGESLERKNNPTTKNGTTPTKLCSACGKKSDALMKCRACRCVWYCDKDCQNKHWKEHKKECRPIKQILDNRGGKLDVGTEVDLGPLEKMPPREECPICMLMLPFHDSLRMYKTCCGKNLCVACHFQHQMKRSEQALASTCAFCREPMSVSDDNERSLQGIDLGVKRQPDEEVLVRLSKRVELKDPNALLSMALAHGRGELGLPVDQGKCIELLRESAGLGLSGALYQLGQGYQHGRMGLEQNKEKGQKYLEKAAEGGHLTSKHNLGCGEWETGDRVAAIRHWQLAASGGFKNSLNNVILSFEEGLLHHGDLSKTLQAFYLARAEIMSDDRDKYIEYLKLKGEYKEEHDL